MEFDDWMSAVDNYLSESLCGLTSDDLPDACYYDMWEDGMTPKEAANSVIADEF